MSERVVFLVSVQQSNGEIDGDADFQSSAVFETANAAFMNAFHLIAEWTEGDYSPYNAKAVLKFRDAVAAGNFDHALNLWNNEMSSSCSVGVEEVVLDTNTFNRNTVASEALTLLFGDGN